MKNKDLMRANLQAAVSEAMQANDQTKLVDAFVSFADSIEQDVLADAEAYRQTQDASILASRGVRVLTSEEKKYYNSMIAAMKSADPRAAITNLDQALPQTVIKSVQEDIVSEFPLLDAVNFVVTTAVTKMVLNATGQTAATWGALTSAIVTEITGAVKVIDITKCKLTAYMSISEDMLDEGPAWVDAYVRALLTEAIGIGACQGVIAGTGKDQPIGMIKNLDGAVTEGVYPDKTANAITKLDVSTFGKIASALSKDANGRPRKVDEILMVVNPVDYFEKVMPASTYLTNVGTYVQNVFPYPVNLIQDVNVPSGKAIFGLAKKYFLGANLGGKAGKLEYSDEFKFLEDLRTYKVKSYMNGQPEDNNAFYVADISGLKSLQ